MTVQRTVKKSLIGQEDILYGEGSVTQSRAGNNYTINKVRTIYPVNSIAERDALDTTKITKCRLYSATHAEPVDYEYIGSAWVQLVRDTRHYNTVALAKADTTLAIGDKVKTWGYTAAGDGGAEYLVVAGGTGTDDGGSYHDMTNGNQLELIVEGLAIAKQFGLKGDGVTDDKAALANIDAYGDFVFFAGTYKVSSNITISSNVVFMSGAVLKPDTGVTITINGTVTAGQYRIFEADNDGTTGAIRGNLGGVKTWGEWWGALPNVAAGVSVQLNEALQHVKARTNGGIIYRGSDTQTLEATIYVPEKCGIIGVSFNDSRYQLKAGVNLGAGKCLFENETKTGNGQEFMYLERLTIQGNRGAGSVGGGILGQQVFVNSSFSDLVVQSFSSHNIHLAASPNLSSLGEGGPVELRNVWSRDSGGNTLRVEGDFKGVNVRGGAYELVDAGQDVIHIDGSKYSGTRATVRFYGTHLEYSEASVRGIYIKKSLVEIYGGEIVGNQLASQTNIYVEDDQTSTVTINNLQQGAGTRTGVNFVQTGIINNNTYISQMSTAINLNVSPHLGSGTSGADITLDMNWKDRVALSAGSATSIANITNAPYDIIFLRFATGNYTVRHNANIQLASGSDHVMTSGDVLPLVRYNNVFYELKGT